jgi:hypothetical protein
MLRCLSPLAFGLFATVALFAAVACSSDTGEGGKVNVSMKESSLTVSPASVPRGPVEFTIKNDGEKQHSLLIIKTSIPPGELPKKDDGSIDKGAADVDVQHEVDEIDGGDDTSRTYQMDPGTYVLISNTVREENNVKTADYSQGMYASLTVTEGSGAPSASATATASATPTKAVSGSATPTKTP